MSESMPAPATSARGVIEAVLAAFPELPSGPLEGGGWGIVLTGEVRHRVPVAVTLAGDSCVLRSFLLRGPRPGPGAAALHRVLLRKNAATRWVQHVLDSDDDVVLQARIPVGALTEATLQEALGEILTLGESAFEPLVHLAYPGVFPPLARGAAEPNIRSG